MIRMLKNNVFDLVFNITFIKCQHFFLYFLAHNYISRSHIILYSLNCWKNINLKYLYPKN